MFDVVDFLTGLNPSISNVWGSASLAQRPLTTGIVRRPCDVTTGVIRETALDSSTIFVFQMENTSNNQVKLKMSLLRPTRRVCCNDALGIVWIVCQIPWPICLAILLHVYTPSYIVTTNTSRTGLNPLNQPREETLRYIWQLHPVRVGLEDDFRQLCLLIGPN